MGNEQADRTTFDAEASSNDDGAESGGDWAGTGPKPWWVDDPELAAIRQRVLDELGYEPAPARDDPDPVAFDAEASSNDDGAESGGDWAGTGPKPWWVDNAELAAARQRVLDELDSKHREAPSLNEPDPILNDVLSGGSRRELGAARDDLARAQSRYDDAIRTARTCGLSWGEIGAVLGVPRQLLHRRFTRRLG